MANTITNFLVGVGFDYDTKGAQEIGSGIDNIRSKALQLGTVVAGAFGIKALTADFAESRDELGRFAEVFGVSANDAQAFGNALAAEGGSLDSFLSQLENIERLRAGLLVGDAGFIAQAGRAGIDTAELESATTATEAYLSLADQFAVMTQQQRLNAASALGLDEASIKLLSQGREEVDSIIDRFRNIRPVTTEMTDAAREFNREWVIARQNVAGVADAISTQIVPIITGIGSSINSWFDDSDGDIARAAGLLTAATFGNADPSEVADATGLPELLFTPIAPGSFDESTLSGQFLAPVTDFAQDTLQFATDFFNRDEPRFVPFGSQITGAGQRAPQTQQAPVNVNATLTLDGEIIDRRTIRVLNGQVQNAIDDIESSNGG